MHRITFLYVGRVKTEWISQGCEHFVGRLKQQLDLQMIELAASKNLDDEKQKQEETEKILEKLEKLDGEVWLLDVAGKEMSSVEFSEAITKAKDSGRPLIFVLGGAYGVTQELKDRADRVLSLSKMTFPHEFCCLVFLEQLYRACEIERGSGYHH